MLSVKRGLIQKMVDSISAIESVSKSAFGYVRLDNGLIIQWGWVVANPANTWVWSAFPISFPTACVSATISAQGQNTSIGVQKNTTQIAVITNSAPVTIYYIAIGY